MNKLYTGLEVENRGSSSGIDVMLSAVLPYLLNLCSQKEMEGMITCGTILSHKTLIIIDSKKERRVFQESKLNKTGWKDDLMATRQLRRQ